MPSSLPWHDPNAYAPVLAGGRSALAWELLRRDPGYRAFAARFSGQGRASAGEPGVLCWPRSSRYTFAIDPAQDCTRATPIWSADVDPHVLRVRASAVGRGGGGIFDCGAWRVRAVHSGAGVHLRIEVPGEPLRLDVDADILASGPVTLTPEVRVGADFEHQLIAVRRLDAMLRGEDPGAVTDRRLPRLVLALRVFDALAAGASLREIGLTLLGGSDWPGDGEHLKSRTRRLVVLAETLMRAGPRGVLRYEI